MRRRNNEGSGISKETSLVVIILAMLVLALGTAGNAVALRTSQSGSPVLQAGNISAPGDAQDFQDVPTTYLFYQFIHNLVADGIVSGYACGGTGEPCVAPGNLPYYRPAATVSRGQMSKFVDNGRRNIEDAVGHSLALSADAAIGGGVAISGTAIITGGVAVTSTTYIAVNGVTSSGGEGVRGVCLTAASGCWAVQGYTGVAGNYAGHFTGGRGVLATSSDDSAAGLTAQSTGPSSAGGEFASTAYRSVQVDPPPSANGFVQLGVTGLAPTSYAERIFNGGLYVEGDMVVAGSKTGYVVDIMQNADSTPLQPGDVVTIVGSSPAVLGQIPVVTVKKATTAYDTGVVGIVDQALYVPDAQTLAAYAAQEKAMQDARNAQSQIVAYASAKGAKPDLSKVQMPQATITDEQGMPHATDATSIASNGYANVVTLGSYRAVKVDAGYGAIRAGDLLTSSPNSGYAMKATDRSLASGATIGKALGSLDSGTGFVPVMVTLK